MKICPKCQRQCADDAKYCIGCKTNIEKVPTTKGLHRTVSKGAGCLVLIIAVVVALLLLVLIPGSPLNPSSHSDFMSGVESLVGR
ncbi:MAG TPA: hypothetical protein DEB31_03645 [Clostridiales bacterium]|nr:hypothetical protein [Clostridiales bacterium]